MIIITLVLIRQCIKKKCLGVQICAGLASARALIVFTRIHAFKIQTFLTIKLQLLMLLFKTSDMNG